MRLRGDIARFVARPAPPEAVEDITQEIFLRINENVGALRDDALLAPWLFRIARSAVADHHRRQRAMEPFEDVAAPSSGSEDACLNEEVAGWIEPMLALLPEKYREALRLTELGGLSQTDLAGRLGISASGARSRVQRGRQMLEAALRACCTFETDGRGKIRACAVRDDATAVRARKKIAG